MNPGELLNDKYAWNRMLLRIRMPEIRRAVLQAVAELHRDGTCDASKIRIAEMVGVSTKSVQRHLLAAAADRLIGLEKSRGRTGSVVTLLVPPEVEPGHLKGVSVGKRDKAGTNPGHGTSKAGSTGTETRGSCPGQPGQLHAGGEVLPYEPYAAEGASLVGRPRPQASAKSGVVGSEVGRGDARERNPAHHSQSQDRDLPGNAANQMEGRIRREGDASHRASQPPHHFRDAEAQSKGWQSFAQWQMTCVARSHDILLDGPICRREEMADAKVAARKAKPSKELIRQVKEAERRAMAKERQISDLRAGRSTDGMTIANVGAVEGDLGRAFLVGVIAAEIAPMPKRARGGALEKRVATIRADLAAEGHPKLWVDEICADIDGDVFDEVHRRDDERKERRNAR